MAAAAFARLNAAVIRTFGGSISFQPAAGGAHALSAIHIESATPEERSAGNVTSVFFDAADFAGSVPFPARGDSMMLATTTYRITDVQSDAQGGVRVLLRKS